MRAAPGTLMVTSGRMTVASSAENPQGLAGLRLNAEVAATVTRMLSPRQVQLAIAGQRVLADTYLQLQPGSRLQLRVIQTDPRPVLKILASAGPLAPGAMPAARSLLLAGDPFAGLSSLLTAVGRLPVGSDGGGGALPA